MRRSIALVLLLAGTAAADSWPAPRVMTVFSEDGTRFARVTPGESIGETVGFQSAERGAHAQAQFYERQADRSYRVVADVTLVNPVAPVDLLLSNAGYLITFDNWHNAGYGKVVAIYDPTGKPTAAWELEQLYVPERLGKLEASVSSRWWRCEPFHFVDPVGQTKVTVRESLGGYFVFDLAGGGFEYFPGEADCRRPDESRSGTISR